MDEKFGHADLVAGLLWAGGMSAGRITAELATHAPFHDLLDEHRVIGRFLDRIEAAALPDEWGIDIAPLDLRYRAQRAEAADLEKDAVRLVAELGALPERDGTPLILLKGNSAARFLNGPRVHRATADLDLLPADSGKTALQLQELGFRSSGHNFCHEEDSLECAARPSIDLHRYFPVWRYPRGSYHQLSRDGYELTMLDWVRADRLSYDTVLATSLPHPGDPSGTLRVTGVTMTAFVLVLHVFHDYVAPALCQPVAKVRLAELCELRDLLAHPQFDVALFEELVESHRAHDATALSRTLLASLEAPHEPLRHLNLTEPSAYPQEIGFGLLADARTSLPDLLLRSDTHGRLFAQLGAADIDLGSSAASRVSTRKSRTNAAGSFRVLHSSTAHPERGRFDFDCTIGRDDTDVVFELEAAGGPGVFFDEFVLFFGNEIVHTAYDVYLSAFRTPPADTGCGAHWRLADDAWTVRVTVPATLLERHRDADGSVPVLLQAGRFLKPLGDDWDELYRSSISSACVPLRIRLGEQAA